MFHENLLEPLFVWAERGGVWGSWWKVHDKMDLLNAIFQGIVKSMCMASVFFGG